MNKKTDIPKKIRASDIWPRPINSISQQELLSLDEYEFQTLSSLFAAREFKRTHSKTRSREIKRTLKNIRIPYSETPPTKQDLIIKCRPSPLLESFVSEREKKWVRWSKREEGQSLEISNFSFLDYPIETMGKLQEIALKECTNKSFFLHFVDTEVFDIAPYMILGLMRRDMMPFLAGGKINPTITHVMKAVGLDGFLKMQVANATDENIYPFKLQHYRVPKISSQSPATDPTRKELTIDNLVLTINTWLSQMRSPKKLSADTKANIINMVGEILNNAERHSNITDGLGSWSVAGFMMKKKDVQGKDIIVCHLSFISEGCSIAESLMSGDEKTKMAAMDYYKNIAQKTDLSEETCHTVYALQDGVTRLPTDLAAGGSGLMEIAEVAANLSENSQNSLSQVTIISGKSCINFKTPYIRGSRGQSSKSPRTQYFNAFNQINEAPDKTHVFNLKFPLPGTLISIRFTLEDNSLENIYVIKHTL